MAADVLVTDSSNPCCAELKEKYFELKKSKNSLYKGLKVIEVKIDDLVKENLQLKKDLVQEQLCVKQVKEEESSIRQELENEINVLKKEISSHQKKECLINVNKDDIQLLKARILEGQDEIKRLTELLQKEKKKSDCETKKTESERKKAESEKTKAAEAWKLVTLEKSKVEEARSLAEIERKKAGEYRLRLEKAESEAKEVIENLKAKLSKAEDARIRAEADKEKTSREKTRANSLNKKVIEQKRLMEVERKRAFDEKVCADRLFQMLEEEKHRREELQKKIQEIELTSKGKCDSCNGEERHSGDVRFIGGKMKLIRDQLKLEKQRAKHTKRVAKLEKAEKSYVVQEFHFLKRSFMHILSRFNMIDERLSHSIEGTDAVTKIGISKEIHGLKLKNNLSDSHRCNPCSRIDCGLTETCCLGSFNFTEPTQECAGPLLPRGSCTRPTTGIISELESPIGGSDRNKPQNSAICSNDSFSDKRSMGSQEKGSIACTASGKLSKEQRNKRPTVMKLPSEVAKTWKVNELAAMENDVDKSYGCKEVDAFMYNAVEAVDGKFHRRSKRRKVHDTEESRPVAGVYTENDLQEKSSTFKDISNTEGKTQNCSRACRISQNRHNGNDCFLEDLNTSRGQDYSCGRNTMESEKQPSLLQAVGQNDNKKQCNKFQNLSYVAETQPSSDQVTGNMRTEQEGNALSKERADLISFENMIRGDYLKLLDLDNSADEERYRMTVEMPLSPSLPEFEFPNCQLHVEDDDQCAMEIDITKVKTSTADLDLHHDGCLQSSTSKVDNFISNSVMNRQIKACGRIEITTSHLVENRIGAEIISPNGTIIFSSKNQVLDNESSQFTNGDTETINAEIAKRDGVQQLPVALKQKAISIIYNIEDSFRENLDAEVRRAPVCCVVFSNIKDKDIISRILCMVNTLSHQNFMVSQIDHVVLEVHSALAMNTVLLPQEKASVFFSLLLCNITSRMPTNSKCVMSGDLLPCFESFAEEIKKGLSNPQNESLFNEICSLHVLAGLIEDFLIERKIFIYIDRPYESSDTPADISQLDGAYVFSRDVTLHQFVAGCIVLASFFAAVDRIGFLLEASYRVLRICRNDISWILLALHIFTSVCGKEFFNAKEHRFLIITLASVVKLLERGHQSVSSVSPPPSPCLRSMFEAKPSFSSCNECQFSESAVCMDKLINLLLDVLQCHILTGVGNPIVNNSVELSICIVPACTDKSEENKHDKSEPDDQRALCHFSDIISLLELVGCYMSWEWTNKKIIPRLSKMLESCKNEEFSAALFVLLGQLGRFGIDMGGHDTEGISELRCSILMLIDTSIVRKTSFRTQLASIDALLNLLPLSFKDIIDEYEEFTPDTDQASHSKLIKKWYHQLSKQQQSLSLNLFGQS